MHASTRTAAFPARDDVVRRAKKGESALIHTWQGTHADWKCAEGVIYIDPKPFANGSFRRAHYAVMDSRGDRKNMVVKFFKEGRGADAGK
jgi:hypothetical protein